MFLACLFLSSFYWLVNVLSNQYTSYIEVAVKYNHQSPDYIILSKLPPLLKVSVSTDGYSLLSYQFQLKKTQVEIDFSTYKFDEYQNKHEIIFNNFLPSISKQLGKKLIINEILPKKVQVILEKKVVKSLKVIPNVKLTFKNQYQLSEGIIVIPSTVEVTGPASILDSIKSIPTYFEEMNDMEGSLSKKIKLDGNFLTTHHLQTKNKSVEIKINTDKFTEYKLNLPIAVTNVSDTVSIDVIPQTIEIKFLIPLSKLAQLKPSTFEVMVNYNELSASYKKLKVHLVKHPDFVKNITLKPAKVEYVLKRKEK